jgi:type IX secretion system PorP/SprF family membrane protein
MNKVQIKNTGRMKAFSLLVLLFVLCIKANAQFDPMFTQYMNNEMFINPAYAGTRGVMAATLLYRDQWVGITGAPKTQTFSINTPLGDKNGIGISAMSESIGISRLFRANANYSYRIKTGDWSHLSFGLMGGVIQYHQNMDELVLINPDDHLFVPNTPNAIAPNAGFGTFFYTRKFYVGFSIPRLIKNSFEGSKVLNSTNPKDWHYYLTSAYVADVSDQFKLKTSMMIKEVYGAPLQAEVALHGLIGNFWWIGVSYRSGDAVSAITGFQITPQLKFFYSYDYALTDLNKYSAGSHEITIGYDFTYRKTRITSPRLF